MDCRILVFGIAVGGGDFNVSRRCWTFSGLAISALLRLDCLAQTMLCTLALALQGASEVLFEAWSAIDDRDLCFALSLQTFGTI